MPDITGAEELKARRTYDATGSARRTAVLPVGTRIGAALQTAKRADDGAGDKDKQRDAKTQNSPVAHMRRAHWHHYWTGPKTGERKLILKWLPPIPVNIEGEAPTVIRKVKPDAPQGD